MPTAAWVGLCQGQGQGLQRGFPSQWQGLSSRPSSVAFLGSAAGSWMTSGVIRPWQHPVWGVGPNYLGPYPYLEGPEAPCLGLAQLCWNHPRSATTDARLISFKQSLKPNLVELRKPPSLHSLWCLWAGPKLGFRCDTNRPALRELTCELQRGEPGLPHTFLPPTDCPWA